MGCMHSKHIESAESTQQTPPPYLRPLRGLRPPTPPTPSPASRKRQTSGSSHIENPQRKWQRRQMGELFNSGSYTSNRVPTLPEVEPTPPPTTPASLWNFDQNHSPRSHDEPYPFQSYRSMDSLQVGVALPYVPPPLPTPQPASSVYSSPDPVTPSDLYRRHSSYRSYSGKLMYSPVRFPPDSSPYGTPTIRVVKRAAPNSSPRSDKDESNVNVEDGKSGLRGQPKEEDAREEEKQS